MFKSISYVIKENISNIYRIFCIAKYELLGEMRDSKFGLFWNFASPAIQVATYYLVFGLGMSRGEQQGIPYLPWVVVGFCAWWFIQPCIVQGCSAIFSKTNVITKMKFPVSILPMTVCAKELFNHLCMLVIALVVLLLSGYYPNVYWLGIIYYAICALVLVESLALITSVLTMLWRDVKKLITSLMRMILYLSPVLWPAHFDTLPILNFIMKLNPVYYIVQGYRDCIFFGKSIFAHPAMTLYFWVLIVVMFSLGCFLMYKFKTKFIDMI
ncbi:MAG: ABC transporter permease [Longicatena sp.]